MALVGVVSFAIFAAIGVNNQQNEKSDIERALEQAVDVNGGVATPVLGKTDGDQSSTGRTPIYSVTVLMDKSIIVNTASTAEMDADTAAAAIDAALDSAQDSGELAEYTVFYRKQQIVQVPLDVIRQAAQEKANGTRSQDTSTTDSADSAGASEDDAQQGQVTGTRIAFADTVSYNERVTGYFLMLFALWALLMAGVFVITLFLARLVTKPVGQAWENQQRFIADASHELKTPLTVILADASILAENPERTVGEQKQWVEGISAEAVRMQQLTEGMLTLAQADAGADLTSLMGRVKYSQLIEGAILQFEAVAFERGLIIEADIDEGLDVRGDKLRLEGLIKTLLENACKYSVKPGTIHVGLHRVKSISELTVHNAGKPIPPEDLPHLFDRFYRSDKSRVREGETASFGLGLSIAKSTVEVHGGSIEVRSDENGTVFTARIPLIK